MMRYEHDHPDLEEATRDLENAVNGELPTWSEAAHEAVSRVVPAFKRQLTTNHKQICEQILEEDNEMHGHVDRMQDQDQVLLKEAEDLLTHSSQLQLAAARVEPHEGLADSALKQFTKDAHDVITHIRQQEAAHSTWLQEALVRVRGPGD
jgi:hypothetical protein